MALTKIKTGGITDSAITTAKINDDAVTDAKVADAITVTAATISGSTLASGVTASSLTSVGTLGNTTLQASGNSTYPLTINNSSGQAIGLFYADGSGDGGLYLKDSSGNTDVRILTDGDSFFKGGNVGIGISPIHSDYKVSINTATNKNVVFTSAVSETGNVITLQGVNDGASALVDLGFRANNFIFADGDVGIGTSTNIDPHGYNGRVLTVATESGNDIGSINIGQANNDSDGSAIGDLIFSNLGTSDDEKRTAIIRGVVDGTTGNARGGKLYFYTKKDGQDAFHATTIDRDGVLTVAGDLVVTNDIKISSGRGISFTANSNASDMTSELLDDYEEGTWSPGLYTQNYGRYWFSGSQYSNSATPTSHVSSYVKIGKMVTVWSTITFTGTKITSYDNIGVTSLPFNTVNRTGYIALGSLLMSQDSMVSDASLRGGTRCLLGANTTHLSLGTSGVTSGQHMGNFSQHMVSVTGGTITLCITYETA